MTDLSRRSFLRGMLTVAALSVAPALPTQADVRDFGAVGDVPRIVGDGVHDDTAGLQAAFDGKPFICEGQLVRGADHIEFGEFGAGTFRVTSPLTVTRSNISIRGAHLIGDHDGDILRVADVECVTLENIHFQCGTRSNATALRFMPRPAA